MNPLDQKFKATLFAAGDRPQGKPAEISAGGLMKMIAKTNAEGSTVEEAKAKLPLFKFARFRDNYRKGENLIECSAIEGDYDGEVMSMGEAAKLLERKKIAGLFYTSPRHTPQKPRWRVIVFLTQPVSPAEHNHYLARLNGVLGGVLAGESFTPSQAYFYGSCNGQTVETIPTYGDCIDARRDLDRGAIGKAEAPAKATKPKDGVDRDKVLLAIACDVVKRGGTFEDFNDEWPKNEYARAHVEKHKTKASQRRAVKRAWQWAESHVDSLADRFGNHGGDGKKPRRDSALELFWADDDDGSADMEPLIEGILFQRTLAAIGGQYGVGKSFVALDMALHVATGRPWFDRKVEQGAVVYVAPEGYHGLKRRRAAWCKHHQVKAPRNFALARGSLDVQRPDGVTLEHVAHEAKAAGAKLIIIDTLNAVFGGEDEDKASAMSKARFELERLRDLSGATVLVIHHAGKNVERGLRGSSVLGGALDTLLFIDGGRIISEAPKGKQKDVEAAPDIPFVLQAVDLPPDSKGRPVTAAVVMGGSSERFEDHDKLSAHEQAALTALRRAWDFAELKNSGAVSIGEWRTSFYRRPEIRDAKADTKLKAFQRAKSALVEAKHVRVEGENAYLD